MKDYLPILDDTLGTYVFFIFLGFTGIQLIHVLFIFGRLAFHRKKTVTKDLPPVSIIIAARNESENLHKFLPFVLEQDYPDFEVIVINHQSMDDSQYVLNALQRQYPKLSIVQVERSQHLKYGKKLPLTLGIKRAKHEHMLFTDADCKPASNQWIKIMIGNFSTKKQIVLGYGPYEKRKGLLNFLIRFDTAWIAMNYMSMAKSGLPYMGIGRNMGYTKSVFNKVNGFKSHYALSSGDDDLFIQEAAKNRNYTINNNLDSYCYSPAPRTWKDWFNQKSRHYTTSERYKVIKKLMLGIYPLTLILLNISFVILLLDPNFFWITLACYSLLLIVKWIILGKAMSKLNEKRFIVFMPIMDIVYAILAPTMYYAIDKKELEKW
jgi:cellulose synthase/poly-beta-1,6-N-acetylglucosamine synthase-like glycosyltransferase